MPRNILQDVTPPNGKRSIRDIPLPNGRKIESENLSGFSGPIEGIRASKKREGGSKMKWWIFIIIIFIVVSVTLSTVFAGATITLVPKQEEIQFNASLTAVRNDVKTKEQGVPFKLVTIEGEGSRTTSDVEKKDIDKKSSGEIIIFNDYDSSQQRLVKNTRFETPEGLIYRIPKSVVVPGRTVEGGKTIPGSVTVTVYADSPGEDYNIGLTDFTVPGFKGTDRFSKFYARSKTAMTGGFSGIMNVISDSDLEKMRGDIHVDLTQELKEKIFSQIPEGFVLYDDGIFVDFESQPNIDLGDSVQVIEKGVLNAVLFDKLELSNYVANTTISDLGEGSVEILNIEDLTFSIKDKEFVEPWEEISFEFDLSGLTNFAWIFDEVKMKNDFAGQPKKNTTIILSNYVGIREAEATVSPFWKRSFPKNVNRIDIERVFDLN